MPVSFHILPARSLVYVRYEGRINLTETAETFARYAAHADCRPGQHQLVDLAAATAWEPDFAQLMNLQAQKAETFLGAGSAPMLVYHAPTPLTRAFAHNVLRSWDGLNGVIPVIQESESAALAVLGQPEKSFAQLLQSA